MVREPLLACFCSRADCLHFFFFMFNWLISVDYFAYHKNVSVYRLWWLFWQQYRVVLLQMKTSWFCFGSPYHLGVVNMNCPRVFYREKLHFSLIILPAPFQNTQTPCSWLVVWMVSKSVVLPGFCFIRGQSAYKKLPLAGESCCSAASFSSVWTEAEQWSSYCI